MPITKNESEKVLARLTAESEKLDPKHQILLAQHLLVCTEKEMIFGDSVRKAISNLRGLSLS